MPKKIDEVLKIDVAHKKDMIPNNKKDYDRIKGKENMIEAVWRRVVTRRGKLVHRPDYGVGLGAYQNALASLDNQLRLAEDIKVQLKRDPRVIDVKEVSLIRDQRTPDTVTLRVRLDILGIGNTTLEEVFE